LLTSLIGHDLIPGAGAAGDIEVGSDFQRQRRHFAGAVAGALKAKRLLLLTDVPACSTSRRS